MSKDRIVRGVGWDRHAFVAVVVVLVVSVGALGTASPVLAKEPTGEFSVFTQCSRFTPEVSRSFCLYARILSGEVTLNKLRVPIVNATTFQGMYVVTGEASSGFEYKFVGALNGETLSNTPQPVPGGLSSLINCEEMKDRGIPGWVRRRACKDIERSRFTAVNETVELARPASEIYINPEKENEARGAALSLPVRIHLENPLLGKECYIGSSADPVMFNMGMGFTSPPPPNKPITGKFGQFLHNTEYTFVELTEHALVDNAFSAPEATGCGGHFSPIIDHLIDNQVGLPSPAGYNTVIHEGTAAAGYAPSVIASEQ
jgi:hypothetical protein